jgi:uncharacterized protein with PhoU and TrkA domain
MMPFDIEMDNDFVELQPDQQLKVDTITLNTDSGNIVINVVDIAKNIARLEEKIDMLQMQLTYIANKLDEATNK